MVKCIFIIYYKYGCIVTTRHGHTHTGVTYGFRTVARRIFLSGYSSIIWPIVFGNLLLYIV